MKNKVVLSLIVLLSFLGFATSAYLTIVHYKNIIPPCSLIAGCEKVLTSQFSEILGIPVALFGSIYFAVLIIFSVFLLQQKTKNARFPARQGKLILLILTFFGALGAIYFLFIQAFILNAFCQYCLITDIVLIAIFTLAVLTLFPNQASENN